MSGLGQSYGGNYGDNVNAGPLVTPKDQDEYYQIQVSNPSVSTTLYGTCIGTGNGVNTALTLLNQQADWPRNFAYVINGITNGTYGGTFSINGIDQFGVPFSESVTIGTAVNGGTTYGSQIAAKFISGTFSPVNSAGTFIGTASIGVGTASNGSAQSNWFGLLTKVGGTSDLKLLRWVNNGTLTTLNKGTSLGSLINTTLHGFQGTSGVAITDSYTVTLKPSWDNVLYGTLANL